MQSCGKGFCFQGSSQIQVLGPADPVIALEGDDIILLCYLKPNVSAKDMIVEWTRTDLKTPQNTKRVHLYRDGRYANDDQLPAYMGRTSLFPEELKNGNVSLKLSTVKLTDAGSYGCLIPLLSSQVKGVTIHLTVGAVSQPMISIEGTKNNGVVLKCDSGSWYPEPEMTWLDSDGAILSDGPTEIETETDSEGRYTVRAHVTVQKTDSNRFTCRVLQHQSKHMKETKIHVPVDVFPKSNTGWILGLSIIAFIACGTAAVVVYMWRKKSEQKKRFKKYKEEQDTFLLEEWERKHEQQRVEKGIVACVDRIKAGLIQSVTKAIEISDVLLQKDLIKKEIHSSVSAAGNSQDQMKLLFQALDSGGSEIKSAFYSILLEHEPDLLRDLDVQFMDNHRTDLIQMVTKVKPIVDGLLQKDLIPPGVHSEVNDAGTRHEKMSLLCQALDSRGPNVKSAFYRILMELEPDLVYFLNMLAVIEPDERMNHLFKQLASTRQGMESARPLKVSCGSRSFKSLEMTQQRDELREKLIELKKKEEKQNRHFVAYRKSPKERAL
ncbi:butyrophilin subfamily 2 member A1 isoform X2 [Esox lucius]|uniref:butyrophilin subfamily 2 member A1 isoform X2 n=1 Tax=Esox lucius TaxID=8010 RepID=UPI001476F001|nr:butyrophilin subfamily 2 member A1 isoform X2 [Esox lucius]